MNQNLAVRTVIIADDNPEILDLIARMLRVEYEVIAQVPDGEALVEAVDRLRPDAAVVDISMPRLNGIQAVRRFKNESRVAVVYVTGQADPDLVREALKTGGMGYILKASMAEDLMPAIQAALTGELFLSPSLK